MKNKIYRIFTVDKVNGREDATVYGYQKAETAQAALDRFIEQHPGNADLPLHCVLWDWDWN